jgi:endonuclease/exonuclease/phosphatase family metal-dependent hydrolase
VFTSEPSPDLEGSWDTLLLASWNMNGEGGNLEMFLDTLTAGKLGPQDALLIFLQEAPRRGRNVPHSPPPGSHWGKRLDRGEAADSTNDVVVQARKYGLNLLYVPSMRNGEEREDRGNAILSNLPLTDPLALELPLLRERRVVASARIPASWGGCLQVTGLHLDHLATLGEFRRSFGSGRTDQLSALLGALPAGESGLLAGDFNVWYREEDEEAIRLAQLAFPSIQDLPEEDTVRGLGGVFSRRSDYLFARLPHGWEAHYRVLPDNFGSDHRPLVGSIHRAQTRGVDGLATPLGACHPVPHHPSTPSETPCLNGDPR